MWKRVLLMVIKTFDRRKYRRGIGVLASEEKSGRMSFRSGTSLTPSCEGISTSRKSRLGDWDKIKARYDATSIG